MAQITRSSIILWIQDLLGLQSGRDIVPSQINNSVQPVVEVGPRQTNLLRNITTASTGLVTIYTTPTDKDFYLTFASFSFTKDVTSDNVNVWIQVVQNGVSRTIMEKPTQSLTASDGQQTHSWPHPIKIDRGTNISLGGVFTAGSLTRKACVGGFILE